jgi:hypothetical protein
MKNGEWQKSNNPYKMLKFMKEKDELNFSLKTVKIHLYLLLCCKKNLRFRSNAATLRGIESAIKRLKKLIGEKDFHQQEWLIEGEAFSADIGMKKDYPNPHSIDPFYIKDLKRISINRGLYGREAKKN